MKILFFTPCAEASAIGRMAHLVVNELFQMRHDVRVIRSDDVELHHEPARNFECEIISWTETQRVMEYASDADICIYQIGNNFSYHRGCLEWLDRLPGIVCLHDFFLGHLFWAWADFVGRDFARPILENWYGKEVTSKFYDHKTSVSFISYASQCAPMTEWISSKALGVVTHSGWAVADVKRACMGPVQIVPLPYDAPYAKQHQSYSNRTVKKFRLLTVGQVNQNKRVESVIQAIGTNAYLKDAISYYVVGTIEENVQTQLENMALALGVNLTITGKVDDSQLAHEMMHANAICCLRWPTLEAASASAIEAMLYARATIVTNSGFYAELPDDTVVKITPQNEIKDLCDALEMFVRNPEGCVELGERARRYASETFSARRYAESLVAMVSEVRRSEVLSTTSKQISKTLTNWGAKSNPPILDYIAGPLKIYS